MLPYISIQGVGKTQEEIIDSLVKIEPILVWLGLDESDEFWNASILEATECSHIISYGKKYGYHNHDGGLSVEEHFRADQTEEIIEYVLNYKI